MFLQHEYKVKLTKGNSLFSSTFDIIYVTLIGTEGKSERTSLGHIGLHIMMAKTRNTSVITPSSLGRLLLVKLEKEKYLFFPEDELFCSTVVVTTPEKDVVHFPCYRWVSRGKAVELRGGKGLSRSITIPFSMLVITKGLQECQSDYCQLTFNPFSPSTRMIELKMKGFADSSKTWEDLDMMKQVFWFKKTPISEYVSEHWKEDEFFGSQFLNGANPNVIQRCSVLPLNFPVTDQMVQRFLEKGSSLEMEMRKGNLFLCDYKRLQGVPTYEVNGKPLPLTAAFCLFYKNPEDKLLPIAIQLNQQHSEQNPIFLPSDSENDWLLAKMFVRNADFTEHQYSYHLLATHLLAEVFAMATLRNLPIMHPLYKLLIPHFRYTVAINTIRLEGLKELLKRAHSEITYSSLCLPENIIARGLDTIPNFYYRDDGIKLWDIINTFVQKMVEHFYPSDSEVSRDSELQNWINEIFIHGFLGNVQSGTFSQTMKFKQVIQFITMVIFNVSAQHSAVNMGQFDYCSWIANSPPFLRKAPPATKGSSTMSTILETLPDVGSTVKGMASMWLRDKHYSIPLGSYPEEYFDEDEKYFDVTKKIMKYFQAELSYLSESIDERNSTLTIPYNYLNPAEMENSVSL
uniref:Uncharacterized protein n=1 Tax=Esox lucius TaxID=8010 RepID=A0A3P8YHS2_ESOLU